MIPHMRHVSGRLVKVRNMHARGKMCADRVSGLPAATATATRHGPCAKFDVEPVRGRDVVRR